MKSAQSENLKRFLCQELSNSLGFKNSTTYFRLVSGIEIIKVPIDNNKSKHHFDSGTYISFAT